MADASRFPPLALPFALVGAAAGSLSAGLVNGPVLGFDVSQPAAVACAAMMGALTGAVLRRLCVGVRYRYEEGDPDPERRPVTDRWPLHAVLVIAAGAIAGVLIRELSHGYGPRAEWAAGGAACAAAFVPVCLQVLAAGRRAQRARMGSLVAARDQRAVWGILALLLVAATVEALPEWPAWRAGEGRAPLAVPIVLLAALAVTLKIRAADRIAAARAWEVLDAGLLERAPGEAGPGDRLVAGLDLGLGEELLGRVSQGAAYRGQAKMTAEVKGTPELAVHALERAVRRGTFGLVAIGAAAVVHLAATTAPALLTYHEERCKAANLDACSSAIQLRAALRAEARRKPTSRPAPEVVLR
jgi:hypothetical protein